MFLVLLLQIYDGGRAQASLTRKNFGKADLENYSVTRERLLRHDERFLGVGRCVPPGKRVERRAFSV